MRKNLVCITFIVASLAVIIAFATATTYIQLAAAVLLYSLLVCIGYQVFPRRIKKYSLTVPTPPIQPVEQTSELVEPVKNESMIGITDIDKRVFLKLVGGVGLSLFLFSIFNKKAEGLFFKNAPTSGSVTLADTAGNKIDPAQNQPTDGYSISEIDDDTISFYGFINHNGEWYVMRAEEGSFRYSKGDADFPTNWINRDSLKYDYYNSVFKNS